MPIGKWPTFDACVAANSDKADPKAFCGAIQAKIEQGVQPRVREHFNYNAPISVTERGGAGREFVISGVALEEVVSRNGIRYVAEELEHAAETLNGKPMITDHRAEVRNIVGVVREGKYSATEKNIGFRAVVHDPLMREMISDGRIRSVSIGASVDELVEESSDAGLVRRAKGIMIDELSFVVVAGVPAAQITRVGETFASAICEKFEVHKTMPETKEQPPADSGVDKMASMQDELARLKKENEDLKAALSKKEDVKPSTTEAKPADVKESVLEAKFAALQKQVDEMKATKQEPAGKAQVGEQKKQSSMENYSTLNGGLSLKVDERGRFITGEQA